MVGWTYSGSSSARRNGTFTGSPNVRMRRFRCCSTGVAARRLLQKAQGRKGRRRCNGLHVYVQRRGGCMFSNGILVFLLESGSSGMRRVRGTQRTRLHMRSGMRKSQAKPGVLGTGGCALALARGGDDVDGISCGGTKKGEMAQW